MKSFKMLAAAGFIFFSCFQSNAQSCTITCPANMVVKADPGQEGAAVTYTPATTIGDCGALTYTPASGSFFRLGSHSVTVTNASGQKCSFTVTVTDNEAPTLSPITLSKANIWPASEKLKKVAVYYTMTDNGQNTTAALSVYSNDTESNTKDYEIINEHLIRVKASRLPSGAPRIYTITVTATDEAGNKTTRSTTIAVSKTMVAMAAPGTK